VLQQEKLHVLEKEMRQPKQQLEKLVQVVEDDVPLPLKAEQNVDVLQLKDVPVVQKDALAEQKDALAELNVEELAVQKDVPAEQNVDVLQQNVDVDKTLKPFSIFF
jgi:hypothetical protein